MKKMSSIKKSILCAVCIALCVILPMAFHSIPNAGNIYCPMHIPALLCGLVCGPGYGVLCGIAGPVISSIFTGMPVISYLPSMVVEMLVYGLVTGLMMKYLHTGRVYGDLYVSLLAALLAGRVLSGLAKAAIFARGSYSMKAWITGAFVTSLPGIVIQLVLVPAVVVALMKSRLIPVRYPSSKQA